MDLQGLDQATTQVALAVHSSVPDIDWREAIYTVLIAPHGKAIHLEFAFVLSNGELTRRIMPKSEGMYSVQEAAHAHWQLTQDLGQPRWFAMTVRVSRTGKFSTELEYNENYQDADLSKPRPDPIPSSL